MEITNESIIGQLVASNYGTASVFKSFGIDFCCNGNRSINEACEHQKINTEDLIERLQYAMSGSNEISQHDFQSWDVDLLVDYIEKKHHRYVKGRIPEILAHLTKIERVHGEQHPELHEIKQLFAASAEELMSHMKKEELVLFQYIRYHAGESPTVKDDAVIIGAIKNPISVMMHEHDNEGDRFRKIALLSNNYTPPSDGCQTYQLTYSMLAEFEEDLHLHIHLENNILFPKAIEIERKFAHVNAI